MVEEAIEEGPAQRDCGSLLYEYKLTFLGSLRQGCIYFKIKFVQGQGCIYFKIKFVLVHKYIYFKIKFVKGREVYTSK